MKSSNQIKAKSPSGGTQFLVSIRYHQNNSWQGSIQRLDTAETINFRSELEMLSLMESAVSQHRHHSGEESALRRWERETKEVKEGEDPSAIPSP